MSDEERAEAVREGRIRRNTETILAVLLGLVSIGVAYASFQAALYDGQVQQSNTRATTLSAEAQALYIEGNQQWVQDAQLFDTLTNLALDAQNPDPAIAAAAQIKYDTLYFQSVYPEFDAAIQWADEQNAADPELWYSPLDNEDYLNYLYSSYDEVQQQSDDAIAAANVADQYGDALTLNTVLMALSLFLLGIAAVVKQFRVKVILGSSGIVIFVAAAIMTAIVPFIWIGS